MYTSYDKAITALVMAVFSLISLWFGWSEIASAAVDVIKPAATGAPDPAAIVKAVTPVVQNVVPPAITTVLTALTPLLVWAIPNKR